MFKIEHPANRGAKSKTALLDTAWKDGLYSGELE